MTLLCVPIMVRTVESAHADAVQAREHGADLVEYRIDELFSTPQDEPEVLRLVETSPLPCIVTCRPTWEGGHYDGDEDVRVSLLERLGTSERPPRVAATSAASRAGRDVTRFIAFSSGRRAAPHGPVALISTRARISKA